MIHCLRLQKGEINVIPSVLNLHGNELFSAIFCYALLELFPDILQHLNLARAGESDLVESLLPKACNKMP